MKTWLIVNEYSGSADMMRSSVSSFAERSGAEIHTFAGPEEVRRFARCAVEENVQRVFLAGGDGTISNWINAIAPDFSVVELAVLPVGTGNDLARSLDVPIDDFEAACTLAMEGRIEAIDVVRMDNEGTSYFINAANGGFGGKVASDLTTDEKQVWGALAYWLAGITKLTELNRYEIRIEMDDQVIERPLHGLSVANGRYAGGGFNIAPNALLNDGFLDVMTIPVFPTVFDLFSAGANFALGYFSEEGVALYRTHGLRVVTEDEMPFSVDGELVESVNGAIEIIPRALRIVVGENAQLADETRADPELANGDLR